MIGVSFSSPLKLIPAFFILLPFGLDKKSQMSR